THILKSFNCYSNNVFHLVAPQIGGTSVVEAIARAKAPTDAGEIVIENGAGAGTTNRLSPRAATALLVALERTLKERSLSLADILPVSGIDPGTLEERLVTNPSHRGMVVGKTGTYGDVGASALAGVIRTRRYGEVAFAVLDSWVPV